MRAEAGARAEVRAEAGARAEVGEGAGIEAGARARARVAAAAEVGAVAGAEVRVRAEARARVAAAAEVGARAEAVRPRWTVIVRTGLRPAHGRVRIGLRPQRQETARDRRATCLAPRSGARGDSR
ncbi:hypothetical protein A33M_3657 [Rhodovulum sp. PH10]|nr:hypothetical protein A33M_3657 [Rhodovulum sp. PH10]